MEMLSTLLALCEENPSPSLMDGFSSQRASNAQLRCFYRQPEQAVEQRVELLVIWDAVILVWRCCNGVELERKICIVCILVTIIFVSHQSHELNNTAHTNMFTQ